MKKPAPKRYTQEVYETTEQLRKSSFFRVLLLHGLLLDSTAKRAVKRSGSTPMQVTR